MKHRLRTALHDLATAGKPGAGDDALRGRDGPLRVTNPEPRDPLFELVEAIPRLPDELLDRGDRLMVGRQAQKCVVAL